MNRNFILSCLFISLSILMYSCGNKCCAPTPQQGNWVELSKGSGGKSTSGLVSFVIDSSVYITTGIDSIGSYINDLWVFNPSSSGNTWLQKASFPGMGRKSAIAFSVGNKGYLGTGLNGTTALSDFWQFDPAINAWTRVADFPGYPRFNAVGFAIAGYGYLSTGDDGIDLFKDFWKYDPNSNLWKRGVDIPSFKRSGAVSFVYNNKGYIVTGVGTGGTTVNDFYSFDPSQPDSLSWTELKHIFNYSPESYDDGYVSIVRSGGVGFVMLNTKSDGGGDRAFITTGSAPGSNTTWAYNFAADLWSQKTSYERPARTGAIGFTVQNRGFVGFGSNGSTTFSNLDEWKPDEMYNSKD